MAGDKNVSTINSEKARNLKCKLVDHGVDFNCVYCGITGLKPFRSVGDGQPEEPDVVSLDHVIPASLGGSSDRSNLVLSCKKCNNVKNDSILFVDVVTVDALLSLPRKEPKREWQNHPIYLRNKEKKRIEKEKREKKLESLNIT